MTHCIQIKDEIHVAEFHQMRNKCVDPLPYVTKPYFQGEQLELPYVDPQFILHLFQWAVVVQWLNRW